MERRLGFDVNYNLHKLFKRLLIDNQIFTDYKGIKDMTFKIKHAKLFVKGNNNS